MSPITVLLVILCVIELSEAWTPTPAHELLAQFIVRRQMQMETKRRPSYGKDVAMESHVHSLLIRAAFHGNMGKSDGCVDHDLNFNHGLRQIYDLMDVSYEFYKVAFKQGYHFVAHELALF